MEREEIDAEARADAAIAPGNILLKDTYLTYITEEPDPEEVTKEPSFWRRIFHTLFG